MKSRTRLIIISVVWAVLSLIIWFIVGMSNPREESLIGNIILFTIALPAGISYLIIKSFEWYGITHMLLLCLLFSTIIVSFGALLKKLIK